MWRSKKFIIITVTVAAVVAGCLAGVVFANPENGDDSQPEALLDRVCEIYEENTGVTIEPQQLRDAFAQAQSEMRDEALESRLQYLVDQGKITQDEADQYLEWWQSRPDVPFRLGSCIPGRHFFGGRPMPQWGPPMPPSE